MTGRSYEQGWRTYRSLRLQMLLVPVAFVAAFVVIRMLSYFVHVPSVAFLVFIVLMVAWPITLWRFGFFPCPRCGRSFRGFMFSFSWLRRRCAHCGLRKFANHDNES